MKKHIKPVVIFLCVIFIATGCHSDYNEMLLNKRDVGKNNIMTKTNYIGYLQKEVDLAPFEPL